MTYAPRYFIDECLSPELARWLLALGFDAACVRDRGRLAQTDAAILAYCLSEDRVLVTQNAEDFRKLIGAVDMHPRLVILSANRKEQSLVELEAALLHMQQNADQDTRSWMINRVVQVEGTMVTDFELPPLGART